ncbi:uncharacterized protein LOC131944970 [Physella acuta]|uniref:uncharacterized protein LOC131944970 n=1 Tax=Physella acuta TaxID=109671 RepID=UPI0027DD6253|nr:uncharacterized protein LOC131944970 [Physella acuta]
MDTKLLNVNEDGYDGQLHATEQNVNIVDKKVDEELKAGDKKADEDLTAEEEKVGKDLATANKKAGEDLMAGDKKVDKDLQLRDKKVDEDLQLGDKKVDEDLQLGDKKVDQDLQLGDKKVDEDLQLGDKKVDQDLQLGDKKVDQDLQLGDKKVDEDLQLGDKKVDEDLTAAEEKVDEAHGSGPNASKSSETRVTAKKVNTCSACLRSGVNLSRCSQCKCVYYCNVSCQRQDFNLHKLGCKAAPKFYAARAKINPAILYAANLGAMGVRPISHFLRNMPTEQEYRRIGSRYSIFVEITGLYFHPLRQAITVEDQEGVSTHLIFYTDSDIVYHQDMVVTPLSLKVCNQPGYFLLLWDACWHDFLDGKRGIRIDSLEKVTYVFTEGINSFAFFV